MQASFFSKYVSYLFIKYSISEHVSTIFTTKANRFFFIYKMQSTFTSIKLYFLYGLQSQMESIWRYWRNRKYPKIEGKKPSNFCDSNFLLLCNKLRRPFESTSKQKHGWHFASLQQKAFIFITASVP